MLLREGLAADHHRPPASARVKVMARLNVAERRVPQDGRIKMVLSRNELDRLPRQHLPDPVRREGRPAYPRRPPRATWASSRSASRTMQKKHFLEAISKPYGMILVTGPTGRQDGDAVHGAEQTEHERPQHLHGRGSGRDQHAGINQVNVHPKIGLTFANALRSFLRQDPDVIMVGEIRDLETAEIAIKAAQTGHLVLSTLHTNDAPQTLTRLANMGVPVYNIASSILLIMAQRLARRLCPACKAPEQLPEEALLKEGFTADDIAAGMTLYKPVGCDQCTGGYKGRVGIYQVMPISEAMPTDPAGLQQHGTGRAGGARGHQRPPARRASEGQGGFYQP
jgi:type IV pilus assembly protein PilB